MESARNAEIVLLETRDLLPDTRILQSHIQIIIIIYDGRVLKNIGKHAHGCTVFSIHEKEECWEQTL